MLDIIICMKQVIDPEAPASSFKIDTEVKRAIPPKGVPPVLNPFDENALEAALKIKDTQETQITVISMGRNLARPIVKKSLAAGADKLVLLEDDSFEDINSNSTAYVLATAIRRIKKYGLVLCGREAADTNAGQVGSGIAEILGIPSITLARKIEILGTKAKVERVVSDGYEVVEATLPALITASNELGKLRSPTLKAIMAAQKQEITIWNASDLEIEPSRLKRTRLLSLYLPVRESKCELIDGKCPEEVAANLVLKLREANIL